MEPIKFSRYNNKLLSQDVYRNKKLDLSGIPGLIIFMLVFGIIVLCSYIFDISLKALLVNTIWVSITSILLFINYKSSRESKIIDAIDKYTNGEIDISIKLLRTLKRDLLYKKRARNIILEIYYRSDYLEDLEYEVGKLKGKSDNYIFSFYSGYIHLMKNEYSIAENYFSKIIMNAIDFELFYHYAITLYSLERFLDAIDYFSKALELSPKEIHLLIYIARIYHIIEDYTNADVFYSMYLKNESEMLDEGFIEEINTFRGTIMNGKE